MRSDRPTISSVSSSRSPALRSVALGAVGLAGLVTAAGLALATGTPVSDTAILLVVTGAGSAAAALVARAIFNVRRRRSLQLQVLAVAAASTATTIGGIIAASQAMFLSSHDLHVLIVVTTLSATISAIAAVRAADRFNLDTDHVAAITARIGGDVSSKHEFVVTEFDDLAAQLAAASRALGLSQERALAAERSRRELIGWISHDLRAPIANIARWSRALEPHDGGATDASRSEADAARRAIAAEGSHLERLVDDLVELSGLEPIAVEIDDVPAVDDVTAATS